jgi:cytochrome c oxidase subunit 4
MTDDGTVATIEDPALPAGTDTHDSHEPAPGLLPGELRPHPSPFQYVMIAVILCVITALEVGTYYLPNSFPRALYITILLVLAITKFTMVVAWFMHLRFDRPLFRRFFVTGAIGAIGLYTIILATLHVFE